MRLLLGLLSVMQIWALGSSTNVNRFNNQVTLFNATNVAQFAALLGGFFINDSSSTATWNTAFATSGVLDFNGGSLYLGADLLTTDVTAIASLGTIIGNGNMVEFATTLTQITPSPCSLTLTASTATALLTMTPTTGWSFTDQVIAVTTAARFNLYNFNKSVLTAGTTIAVSSVGAQTWNPVANFFATSTALTTVTVYSVVPTTAIATLVSTSSVFASTVNSFSWHPAGRYIAAVGGILAGTGFVQAIPVSATGTLGTIFAGNTAIALVGQACDWVSSGTYLATGFQAGANNIKMYALGGTIAAPTLTATGAVATTGFNVSSIRWRPTDTTVFAVGLNNTGTNVQIYKHNAAGNTLTLLTSVTGSPVNSVAWSPDGTCLYVSVANQLLSYAYDPVATTLTLCCAQAFTGSGTGYTSPVNGYVAQGINGVTGTLNVYRGVSSNAVFINTNLVLQNDLLLQDCLLTFSGKCAIIGNGYTVDLSSSATLAVANNATLRLADLALHGVTAGNLRMLGSSSLLVLDNMSLVLDGTVTFTQGAFSVENNVLFTGFNQLFIYASASTSTIQSDSTLELDRLLTFSYSPPIASQTLLQFADTTASLFLNGATLHATYTGLNLIGGNLLIDGHAYISSSARVQAEGITLGNGSSVNNMSVQVGPAAVLEITSGYLVNKNV